MNRVGKLAQILGSTSPSSLMELVAQQHAVKFTNSARIDISSRIDFDATSPRPGLIVC